MLTPPYIESEELQPIVTMVKARIEKYNAVHGDTLEIMLCDENGYKIHASCKKTYMERTPLPAGTWRHIQNISLSPATGSYRSTDHSYKMIIVQNTTITRSPLLNEDIFLNLVDFQSVLSGTLNPNFLIDVIGQVVDLGELETIQVTGKPRIKVEFTLRDINELQITNAFEALQFLINPAIPETDAFKQIWFHDEKLELDDTKNIQDKHIFSFFRFFGLLVRVWLITFQVWIFLYHLKRSIWIFFTFRTGYRSGFSVWVRFEFRVTDFMSMPNFS
ncbi:LOW QUALITY PROTEIN: hypothetical protein N665_0885s0008 [Sinapis alba]|nr:LOW QUALITY PROTEIN: hypothetical protein N665_0885s0008 [Sinapis alba]